MSARSTLKDLTEASVEPMVSDYTYLWRGVGVTNETVMIEPIFNLSEIVLCLEKKVIK